MGKTIAILVFAFAANAATIAEKTAGTRKLDGYFPLYWDEKSGKLFLEIPRLNTEFLYVNSLPAGLGSNDIGLDRGQIGDSRIVKFERSGPKVLLVQPNYSFRASTSNVYERRAVEEAFARSALWGFQVEAEDPGRVLVDATNFYLRDAHGVSNTLQRSRQGTFRLDASRSAIYLERTKNFPKNTEVEATLTFAGDQPGGFVSSVTPTPEAVTLRLHHSFIELPDGDYKPRAFDPRAGFFGTQYMDYATPVDQPIVKRFISRHRIRQGKPIVYYMDRGAPEPILSALLEGARWWAQAFEAAGFRDGFRVELLPEDADPMDVRYNLIQWIHRSTRGWSYGASIRDPRTGEIIKGLVSLGSLRVRQDFLIAEGLLAPYEDGRPVSPEMLKMALARLRQLAAHEVGHTLGLAHNYAASTANRASVMDYPHPWITLNTAGIPDLSNAYATGIGEWDKVAINVGYREFPTGAVERNEMDRILRDAASRGLIFLTDQDARPEGSASPISHLWDSGANAVDELNRLLSVRQRALERFGANNIPVGRPMATLEDVLVVTYLMHRYQVEAAAKVLGGADYRFALRGDGQKIVEMVPAAEQARALETLLRTIRPETLTIPERLLSLLPPRAPGFQRTREDFRSRTGLTFDPLGAAEAAAAITIGLILNPERAGRLVEQHARNPEIAGLDEVIGKLISTTLRAAPQQGLNREIQRVVNSVVVYYLMALAADERATAQARAIAWRRLDMIASLQMPGDADTEAHYNFLSARIKRFQENPKELPLPRPAEPPPGQPIGCDWEKN
jgi:hypothetical protein